MPVDGVTQSVAGNGFFDEGRKSPNCGLCPERHRSIAEWCKCGSSPAQPTEETTARRTNAHDRNGHLRTIRSVLPGADATLHDFGSSKSTRKGGL